MKKLAESKYRLEKESAESKLIELDDKVRTEINGTLGIVYRNINKGKVKSDELRKLEKEHKLIVDNIRISVDSKATLLWDFVQLLCNNGHTEIEKLFLDKDGNIISKKICPSYSKYLSEQKHLEELSELSYWGAWDRLHIAFVCSLSGKKNEEIRLKDGIDGEIYLWADKCSELDDILKCNKDERRYYFRLNDYKYYLRRVHDFLLESLDAQREGFDSQSSNASSPSPLIISRKSIICGKAIYFPQKGSLQEGILETIVGNNKSRKDKNGKYNYSLDLVYMQNGLPESLTETSVDDIKKAIPSIRRSLKNNGIRNLKLKIEGTNLRIIET